MSEITPVVIGVDPAKEGGEITITFCHAAAYEALQKENAELKEELDRERMRLAACGVAALENTKDCVEKRISKDSPYYSGSYSSVCRAVDEEIRLRDESAAQAKRIKEQLEVIEATADFAKDFYQKADKNSETRVFVPVFKELERKLRTYFPASKNGE